MRYKDPQEFMLFKKGIIEGAMEKNPFATVGDIVFETLEDAILTSKIPAGTRLNISKISEELNVSPTPTRNAIDRLVAEGLIDVVIGANGQYKNYTVFDISTKEMEDLFMARKSIEGMAAYICADRPWTIDIGKMQYLANIFYSGLKEYANLDVSQRSDIQENNVDRQFHKMIVEATENQYIITAYSAIEKKVRYLSIRTASFNARKPKNRLIKMGTQHISIFNAIRDGYPDLARNMMEDHIDYCMNSCLQTDRS